MNIITYKIAIMVIFVCKTSVFKTSNTVMKL